MATNTKTKTKIKRLSAKLGLKEQAVVDQAVFLLEEKVRGWQDLKKETREWEALSDEVWAKIKD